MNEFFSAAMRKATELTRDQNLLEATRVIQRALSGQAEPENPARENGPFIELQAEPAPKPAGFEQPADQPDGPNAERKKIRPLGEVLANLRKFAHDFPQKLPDSLAGPLAKLRGRAPAVPVPEGASWLTRSFACEAGTRDYKLYIPSQKGAEKRPLIVMLHGCTQNADDFAVGAGMNRFAEQQGCVVAYPDQVIKANHMNCWNWFDPKDQTRDRGEPRIIAGMTRAIIAELNIDPERVFVAGLSAGAAMAEVMGVTYPELYAATGIHSGVAYGAATDAASAFAAMSGANQGRGRGKGRKAGVRTIIFHGTSDRVVHPSNGEAILDDFRASIVGEETQIDGVAGGRAFKRTVIADSSGVPQVERWAVEGLGHAWSGGSAEGSYTDPQGPDASREMLRFFLNGAEPATN
jgi:poly(hydroxyalkanoate) depolymerase family esterase